MQHDEVIWQVLNHKQCSFRATTKTQNFCRNQYNVTGLCNRSSCPLANSRYATIREHEGILYLYMKTIERAHTPNKLWERLKLPRNYAKALELVDKHLQYWPKFLVHKNKQRLTKMTQYLIRMRRLALKNKEKIVTMPAKQVKREARREAKAEVAAVLDRAIEKELLERLQSGTYGDIYNFPTNVYNKVLDTKVLEEPEEEEEEEEPVVEYVEGYDELEEEMEDDMEDYAGLHMIDEDGDDADSEDEDDDEDDDLVGRKRKEREPEQPSKRRKRPTVQIEYEDEPQRMAIS